MFGPSLVHTLYIFCIIKIDRESCWSIVMWSWQAKKDARPAIYLLPHPLEITELWICIMDQRNKGGGFFILRMNTVKSGENYSSNFILKLKNKHGHGVLRLLLTSNSIWTRLTVRCSVKLKKKKFCRIIRICTRTQTNIHMYCIRYAVKVCTPSPLYTQKYKLYVNIKFIYIIYRARDSVF